MKPRPGFRRALWGSAALHALALGALVALLHFDRNPPPAAPGIRTVAAPEVRMTFAEPDTGIEVQAPALSQAAPSEPAAQLPRGPVAPNVPQTLPSEVLALIRKPPTAQSTEPVGGAVTEVPATPGAANPTTDTNVKPAGATSAQGAKPIHGALAPNQTVVYVLDASGSMGAHGMFDAARAQLVATLKAQPASARFQVIVYAGAPTPLLASAGTALPMSAANVNLVAQKLAAVEPRGKSDHRAAIRAAAAHRPDVILVLTDSHDLTAAAVKPLLVGAPNATVCVGVVTPDGVQPPRAVK